MLQTWLNEAGTVPTPLSNYPTPVFQDSQGMFSRVPSLSNVFSFDVQRYDLKMPILSLPSPRAWVMAYGKGYLFPPAKRKHSFRSIVREAVLHALQSSITTGHLTISESEITRSFGIHKQGCNCTHIRVTNPVFWLRILL